MKLKVFMFTTMFTLGTFGGATGLYFYQKKSKIDNLSEDEKLGNFALLMMDISGADLSPVRRTILARTLVRVSSEIFSSYKHREAFVGLVAQESKFNVNAKSPVGAAGLTQVMPQYASGFAKLCGLNDFKPADLYDTELNLYLGACFYRDLLENKLINGNPIAAQVAYNSGQNGESLKSLLAQRSISNSETNNYSVMIGYKKEEARNAQDAIEKTTKQLENGSSTPASLELVDTKSTIKTDQLVVSFKVNNTDLKTNATGAVVIVATFLNNKGQKIFVTSNSVTGPNDLQVDDLVQAAKTSAQPFSIKKFKDHELILMNPKGEKGQFVEYKIFALDTRTGGYITKSLPVTLIP